VVATNELYLVMFVWSHDTILAIALSLLAALLWLFLQHQSEMQRAASFNFRDALDFNEWYGRYYGNEPNPPDKLFVEKALSAFGEAFGIEPTRFRPDDRITHELQLQGKLTLDDAWEIFDALLPGIFGKAFEWSTDWRTLDDVIRGLAEQGDRGDGKGDGKGDGMCRDKPVWNGE
jgi:hypothetical protein